MGFKGKEVSISAQFGWFEPALYPMIQGAMTVSCMSRTIIDHKGETNARQDDN
jgi:hypothetical protein